jgi:rod shape-determining protein MreC
LPAALALTLVATGYLYPEALRPVRQQFADNIARPLFAVTRWPGHIHDWLQATVGSRQALIERNQSLEQENLVLQRQVLQTAALMAENARLNELLNSTEMLEDSVLVSELLGVSPDASRQEIMLRRGSKHGVFEGQPVLDASGLVGSITDVSPETARVLLITDNTNAVPIQINRNGIRGIAEGSGRPDELYIRNLVPTTDVKEGDLIISSGLGGRYPKGYPVGEVTRIEYEGADSFLRVVLRPTAHLESSQHFLLLFRPEAKLPATVIRMEESSTVPADSTPTTPTVNATPVQP